MSNPYEGDALNRAGLSQNLVALVTGLSHGVIAIDGAWGAGKTWFGERTCTALAALPKTKTIWVDTFAADWHDDPALTLLAEFSEQLPANKREAFIASVTPLMGKITVAAGKAGLKAVGNFVGLDSKAVDEVVSAAQGAGEGYIKKRIEDLTQRKKSLAALKELLKGAVPEEDGKIVVFVDELDRCSPGYAIRFLERVKHLFDVEGVVFVLLWNREQIQQAVKTFYGQGTDGQMYLDRFVDYPIHLPNHHMSGRVEAMGMIVEAEIQRLSGAKQVSLHEASKIIGTYADVLGLTAREVKHVCSWWVISPVKTYEVFELWLLCLKVKRPDIYKGLQIGSTEAHALAENLILANPTSPTFQSTLNALARFHNCCKSKNADEFNKVSQALFPNGNVDAFSVTGRTIAHLEAIKHVG